MALTILDPTAERDPEGRPLAARAGARRRRSRCSTSASRAATCSCDELEALLRERGIEVLREAKPTFTKPAPVDLRREIADRCDAVIEALAD